MKQFFIAGLLLCISLQLHAQESTNSDTKLFEHSIGLQVNQLIRQVLNFSNSTANANTNPYLLNYSIRSLKTNWGLRVGFGYNYNSSITDNGITKSESKINDLQFRLGVERVFELSDRWTAGAGIDGLLNINNDKTTSVVISSDTSTSVSNTSVGSYGFGAMSWIKYSITDNISIGTEASFYYTTGKQKQDITTTQQSTSGGQTSYFISSSNSSNDISTGTISLPVAIFISIRF
jgi:hypothetical protein